MTSDTQTLLVSCTLVEADLAAQTKRWHELRSRAELGQVATPEGTRLAFRADEGVLGELVELVAVEKECCSWATWSVEELEGEIVLHVRSTGHGVEAVHGLFG